MHLRCMIEISILVDLNNAVDLIVSIRILITNSSSLYSKRLETFPRVCGRCKHSSYKWHLVLDAFFWGPSTCLTFGFLWFSLSTEGVVVITTRPGLLTGFRRPVWIAKFHRILRVSFSRTFFWFVHVLFVCVIKFKSLALFLMDHLSHPIMSSFIFFLYNFSAFTNYVINGLVSDIT